MSRAIIVRDPLALQQRVRNRRCRVPQILTWTCEIPATGEFRFATGESGYAFRNPFQLAETNVGIRRSLQAIVNSQLKNSLMLESVSRCSGEVSPQQEAFS